MTDERQDESENTPYVEQDIPIANIKLDELNFRTDEVDSQRAAIRAMIEEQGNGLIALAEHFLRHGLMPGERLLVIPDDEEGDANCFVVMEGNRRTTVMKLLDQPALAAETRVHTRFVELARQFADRPRRTLPCVVLPDREAALVWVEVKHSTGMAGAGVEKWGAPATARFAEFVRGRVVRWRATLRFLRDRGVDVAPMADGIMGKTTAVSRVLNAGAMREILGVRFTQDGAIEFENGDVEAGARLLVALMEAMAAPDFSTNDVHSFDDRVDFIEGFDALSVKVRDDDASPSGEAEAEAEEDHDSENVGDTDESNDATEDGQDGENGTSSSGDEEDADGADGASDGEDHGGTGDGTADGGGNTSRERRRGVRQHPRQRSTLAPTRRGEELHIADNRLNQLYHEARKLKVEKHTAIAAVLIRVFLELSCEQYLASRNVPLPDSIARRNGGRGMTWHSFGVKFREKIDTAVDHADPDRNKQGFAEIRRGLGSQDHLHSPENLHEYVHGLKTIPSARDLIIIWDRYQPLFSRMFA